MAEQNQYNQSYNSSQADDPDKIADQVLAEMEFAHEPRFSPQQLATFSEISRDIAQVFFASMVIGVFLAGQDVSLIGFGIIASLVFWFLAIRLMK